MTALPTGDDFINEFTRPTLIDSIDTDTPPLPRWRLRRSVAHGSPLTARERQVLELVSHGYSNKEIGRALYVSENSVKNSLQSSFVRLGARDRAHAVRICFELGYLTADPGGDS